MSFNLRHLKYFVATAELGQVSRAAIELSVSQSAVTAAIKELEAVLGTPLFERSARGMSLTRAGQRFLSSAYEILSKVEEAMQIREGPEVSGRLTIAATYTVIGYFLPVHLERLARAQPGLEITIHEMPRELIEEGLVAGRVDVAVALTSNISNPELASQTLLGSRRRLWTPSRHPLLERESVGLADVAEHPFVMLTVDEAAHTAMRYWAPTGHQPRVVLRTSSVEAVRSMVANGLGVTILSDMVYRPWSLEGRRLEQVNLVDAAPPMDVGLVWRRGVEFTPTMAAFREYFAARFLSQPSIPLR
ncbi:LysR family transcriptional regulator [uncultured Albimonas sp.]|uniref:LysR family transcriptional regulator n=1 Tax=uncultured Albimonas sp. TaxID=1331701 RepID=UPI0030EF71E0|tara:strand:- start:1313 stop:2224 length:912 start_codon:yes stop_codon:yes gene_type:complete